MGELLNKGADNLKLFGRGRRATTLWARGRTVKKFLAWLTKAHEVAFSTEVQHLSEYPGEAFGTVYPWRTEEHSPGLRLHGRDRCSGSEKLTDTSLHNVLFKELLSSTLTGENQRQAPRVPTVMVQALEDTVVDASVRFYFRVYAWWILLQCWGTLRFSDHRGVIPDEKFEVKGNSLTTRLTRSKTIGSDKTVSSRSVVVSPTCFVKRSEWLSCGWTLLKQQADYPRDYLLPVQGARPQGASIRHGPRSPDQGLTESESGSAQPTDSGGNFLVSAASAIGVSKTDRDMLGGWAAQESDRYIRVSRSRIAHIQQQVVSAVTNHHEPDPLC